MCLTTYGVLVLSFIITYNALISTEAAPLSAAAVSAEEDGDTNDAELRSEMTTPMGDMGEGGHDGMSMQMYFHAGSKEIILFKPWHVMTWAEMLGSCIAICLLALGYEGFKYGRQVLYQQTQGSGVKVVTSGQQDTAMDTLSVSQSLYGATENMEDPANKTLRRESDNQLIGQTSQHAENRHTLLNGWHWLQTFMYMVQVFLGYVLMLTVMTYNAYLCMAVVIGAGIGYLIFGSLRTSFGADDHH